MLATIDGIEAHQVTRKVESGNLFVTLFGDGIALNGSGTNSVQRFQLVPSLEQRLAFPNRLFAFDNIIQLIELMLVQREGNTELADAAILTVNSTTARLDTSVDNTLFRDHRDTLD
jgi:hypothetical protein